MILNTIHFYLGHGVASVVRSNLAAQDVIDCFSAFLQDRCSVAQPGIEPIALGMTACCNIENPGYDVTKCGLSMDSHDGQQRIGKICIVRLSQINAIRLSMLTNMWKRLLFKDR